MLVLERAEEPEMKLPTFVGSLKKQENSRKTSTFGFIGYAKAFDCVDYNKLWEILQEMGLPDHLTCLLRNLYAGQEPTVKTGHGKWTGSKLGKEYIKAVCCHPAYLTYMQSTSCEMLDETQAGIKISGRIINNLRYAGDSTLMAESEEEQKTVLMKLKKESEKAGSKLNIKKVRSRYLVPLFHGKEKGETMKTVRDFVFWASKSLQMVTAAMKLRRKAMTNLDSILKKQRHYFADKGLSSQGYGFSSSHVWM